MNRRLLLKQFAVASGAAVLMPSCIFDTRKVSIALERLKITPDDEELLAQIAATLIPKTETPGAREVDAHLFALVMADDCLSAEQQTLYVQGLKAFDDHIKETNGSRFGRLDEQERVTALRNLEADEQLPPHLKTFYQKTRGFIVQGFSQSKYFMTEVRPYALVPGPKFDGCVPLTAANITN